MAHILILAFSFLLSSSLHAKDLGIRGHYFLIQETSLLEFLTQKLGRLSEDEMQSLSKSIQNHYVAAIKNPKSLGLTRASRNKITYFDPSIVTNEDIKDANGKIIISKGTYYNPLDTISMTEDLLFFDAEDSKQLVWAKANQGKWILVKGCPIEIENKMAKPVYFDQNGHLVKKLQIDSVPAKVSQAGKKLKIEQFYLRDI